MVAEVSFVSRFLSLFSMVDCLEPMFFGCELHSSCYQVIGPWLGKLKSVLLIALVATCARLFELSFDSSVSSGKVFRQTCKSSLTTKVLS